MSSQKSTATELLAELIVRLDRAAVPDHVYERAKLAVVDTLGVSLAGRRAGEATMLAQALRSLGMSQGEGQATVVTTGRCGPAFTAAALNGTAAFALNLGDTSLRTICHCGPVVVPAALATAEASTASVQDLLVAVVCGYEVMERIARGLDGADAGHFRKGFHPSGTAGVYGAAASVGKLIGLEAHQLAVALGIAGSLMVGTRQAAFTQGETSSLWLHTGIAAGLGTLAATLASGGLDAPRDLLEGAAGVLRAYGGPDATTEATTAELGRHWMLPEMAVKLHCCSQTLTPVVDAVLVLRERTGIERALQAIDVVVELPELQRFVSEGRSPVPASFVEAQSSVPFVVAQALRYGRLSPAEFAPDELHSQKAAAIAGRVRVASGEFDEGAWPARVTLVFEDGERACAAVDHPRGSAEVPVTRDDIVEKVTRLCPELTASEVERSIASVDDGRAGASSLWRPFERVWESG